MCTDATAAPTHKNNLPSNQGSYKNNRGCRRNHHKKTHQIESGACHAQFKEEIEKQISKTITKSTTHHCMRLFETVPTVVLDP